MTANKMNWIAQLQRDLARLNAAIAQWDTRIERWTALAAKRSSKFMNAGEQLIYAHLILARNQTLSLLATLERQQQEHPDSLNSYTLN